MTAENFTNNGETTLAATISPTTTSFSVKAGEGDKLPESDFRLVLGNESGVYEIAWVGTRTVDALSDVIRGYEDATNHPARDWPLSTPVKADFTADSANAIWDAIDSNTGNEAASLPSGSGPFTLVNWLSYLITYLKSAFGGTHWYTLPSMTIAAIITKLTNLGSSVINVRDYGATGDGSTDDTTAIQNAFNALGSDGGVIVFPAGSYKVTSAITHSFSANQHTKIVGYGRCRLVSTVSEPADYNGILSFTGDSGATARLRIKNLRIEHTNSATGKLSCLYVQPDNYGSGGTQSLASLDLDGCRFQGASWAGAQLLGVLGGTVRNCEMNGNRDAGLMLIGCSNMDIEGGKYNSNQTVATATSRTGDYGITLGSSSLLTYCSDIRISGVQASSNGRKGIDVHHGHRIVIDGNMCVGNGYVGIYAVMEGSDKDVGDITVSNNIIDQTGGASTLENAGIQVGTFGTTGSLDAGAFHIIGNKIRGVDAGTNSSHAIRIFTASSGVAPRSVVIEGNAIYKGSGSSGSIILTDANLAIGRVVVQGNTLHTAQCSHGIIVQKATIEVIEGNVIVVDSGTATDGIYIDASALANIIGNALSGTFTTPIALNSNTTCLVKNNTLAGAITSDTALSLPFTVSGGLTLDANGHLLSLASGTPTTGTLGTNVTSATPSGNDVRGTITFVSSGTVASGTAMCVVTFAHAYASAPIVIPVNMTGNSYTSDYSITSVGTGGFTIRNEAAQAAGTFVVGYLVIG